MARPKEERHEVLAVMCEKARTDALEYQGSHSGPGVIFIIPFA